MPVSSVTFRTPWVDVKFGAIGGFTYSRLAALTEGDLRAPQGSHIRLLLSEVAEHRGQTYREGARRSHITTGGPRIHATISPGTSKAVKEPSVPFLRGTVCRRTSQYSPFRRDLHTAVSAGCGISTCTPSCLQRAASFKYSGVMNMQNLCNRQKEK